MGQSELVGLKVVWHLRQYKAGISYIPGNKVLTLPCFRSLLLVLVDKIPMTFPEECNGVYPPPKHVPMANQGNSTQV